MSDTMTLRVFIGKHPCDDLPYIIGTDPDPRSDEFLEAWGGYDKPDYSGWYVLEVDDDE